MDTVSGMLIVCFMVGWFVCVMKTKKRRRDGDSIPRLVGEEGCFHLALYQVWYFDLIVIVILLAVAGSATFYFFFFSKKK